MIEENKDFNNFYIIKKVPRPEDAKTKDGFWLCKCKKCNSENIYSTSQIRRKINNDLDCGCSKTLIGKKFGKLLVIEKSQKQKRTSWICQCDCGNKKEVIGTYLKNGNTKSCGCEKYKGLIEYNQKASEEAKIPIGTRFEKLTVIEDLGFKKQVEGHNRRWYRCQCDCGNFKDVMANQLKNGYSSSCGKCMSSKGEYQIMKIFDENNIFYQHDIGFASLKKETGKNLRFDFILYEDKEYTTPIRMIEFDGRQHTSGPEAIWSKSDPLEIIQERDELKNNFCLRHKYPLVRIPYTKINYITLEDLLGDKYLVKERG